MSSGSSCVAPAICFTPTLSAVPLVATVDVGVALGHLVPLSALPFWMLAAAQALRFGALLADAIAAAVTARRLWVGVALPERRPRSRGRGRPAVPAALVAVLGMGAPAQVLEPVVARVIVRVTRLHPLGTGPHERLEHEAMHLVGALSIPLTEGDLPVPVRVSRLLADARASALSSPDSLHAAEAGHLVEALVSEDGAPLLSRTCYGAPLSSG